MSIGMEDAARFGVDADDDIQWVGASEEAVQVFIGRQLFVLQKRQQPLGQD